MKLFILMLSFLFLVTGCGRPMSVQTAQEKIYRTNYSNFPIFLKLQNSNCSQKSFMGSQLFFNLHLFIQGNETTRSENLVEIVRGTALSNEVISKTIYGEKIESVGGLAYLRESGKELILCPDEYEFFPETIESAALNTSFYINKTNVKFKSMVNDVTIKPIVLNISPAIQKSTLTTDERGETIKQSSYMTDNAFYLPSNHSITFLPHSETVKGTTLNVNFWEVPMVASHEYGHHIFEMIYKSEGKVFNGIHDCFNVHSQKIASTSSSNHRQVKIQDVINAYNEGFADLISFYTLSPTEREVTGVKCLQVTRDVSSPILKNGKPKILSSEVLNSFFSRFDTSAFSSCENPSFQEVHVMGAIFAYNANDFLNEFSSSDEEKLKVIVKWAKTLKEETARNPKASARSFLRNTMTSFIRITLDSFDVEATPRTCAKITSMYPGLKLRECIK